MEKITLKTATAATNIFVDVPFNDFNKNEFLNLSNSENYNKIIIITDSNVRKFYEKLISEYQIIELEPGEQSKTLETTELIYHQLLDFNVDRHSLIVGFGGGVICDITGFVASTFHRGVRFGFISSTLLAQVDASIGGKNGVNYLGYKNIIGTITQPDFVICDSSLLDTLPDKEYINGLAEIIKSSLAGNPDLFKFLENNYVPIINRDITKLNKIITDTISFKVSIVEQDEKDIGVRNILNLGHTFAHALESKSGLSHGEAVSIGLCKSAELSVKMGFLKQSEFDRIKSLLKKFMLPIELKFSIEELLPAIEKDKKRNNNFINYILLNEIGKPVIHGFKFDDLKELF
ncbi:MAG: 3-dehydroquinate synthase [Ignavibacteriae bacterium]|nr:3-dehydroquinate synthase [Ignavibacteriota bacterium]